MAKMTNQEFVEELLRTIQVVRKNMMGNEGRSLINAAWDEARERKPTDEEVEILLADMFPWLFGPKSIMHALIDLVDREPTNVEVYNLLIVAHRLDKTGVIRHAYDTYSRYGKMPEPTLEIAARGL